MKHGRIKSVSYCGYIREDPLGRRTPSPRRRQTPDSIIIVTIIWGAQIDEPYPHPEDVRIAAQIL